jgi:hypothetical protein
MHFIRTLLILIALCISLYPSYAHAQGVLKESGAEPVSNEIANRYFDECVADTLTVRDENRRAAFCACRAANLKQFISEKEYELLFVENKEGDAAFLKYLTYVYGACLKFPIEETVFRDCLARDNMADIYEAEPYCYCKTRKVVSFTNLYGPEIVYLRSHQLPRYTDPLLSYINSPEFRGELQKARRECAISFTEEEEGFGEHDIILPDNLQ